MRRVCTQESLVIVSAMTVDENLTTQLTAISTDDLQTTAIAVTSSTSRDASFYFGCAVVVIAIIGAAANALILCTALELSV